MNKKIQDALIVMYDNENNTLQYAIAIFSLKAQLQPNVYSAGVKIHLPFKFCRFLCTKSLTKQNCINMVHACVMFLLRNLN